MRLFAGHVKDRIGGPFLFGASGKTFRKVHLGALQPPARHARDLHVNPVAFQAENLEFVLRVGREQHGAALLREDGSARLSHHREIIRMRLIAENLLEILQVVVQSLDFLLGGFAPLARAFSGPRWSALL